MQRTATALLLFLFSAALARSVDAAVSILENATSYTLENVTLSATVEKRSGDLLSLRFHGIELLDHHAGRGGGYWSHNTAHGPAVARVSMDPKANGGERGDVSVSAKYEGTPLGSGPGGSVTADIEIHYALGAGDAGLYTYCRIHHERGYPAFSLGEARFCAKLSDAVFDWMTVDARRNLKMLTAYDWNHGTVMNMKEARLLNSGIYQGRVEHKYDYSANQFDARAWGWSSTEKKVGVWFINPSIEYLSGGPTKTELSAHRDATFGNNPNAPAPPTLLNYWRSSHYGGSVCAVAKDEAWTKVIGPFLIYCNSGPTPDAMWRDALRKAGGEAQAWPYEWAASPDYPTRTGRGSATGRLLLRASEAAGGAMSNLLVGLTAPDETVPWSGAGGAPRQAAMRPVDWQIDAKHYQFWVRGQPDGSFTIPNVRPGSYTLHAIADGVLGEFILTNITIAPGQPVRLGELQWHPARFGKTLWEIGVPNRSGSEFFKGDDYYHWGWYVEYPKLFPNDVHFIVGKSDPAKDWFFEQVPHNTDLSATNGTGRGRETTWSVAFQSPQPLKGTATLRVAICGAGTRSIRVGLNGAQVGEIDGLVYNAVINRDGITGTWCERDVSFNAGLIQPGTNQLQLTIPAGSLTSGIIYDYLRLECAE